MARRNAAGHRTNPFDSHSSAEMLQYPTFSPSVFSTVVSPSQDSVDGRFWSVDQQAILFPASISDDSPWKQESTGPKADPESENRTQEAIDLYFSRFSHQITSPEESVMTSRSLMLSNRSAAMMSQGGSPNLTSSAMVSMCATPVQPDNYLSNQKSCAEMQLLQNQGDLTKSSAINGKRLCNQWSQTELTFPSKLSNDLEAVIAQFFTYKEDQSKQPKAVFIQSNGTSSQPQTSFHMEDSNNSTLRRKLFAGFEDSDDSSCESVQLGEHNRNFPNIGPEDNKENTNISKLIAPGTVLFTPTSTKKNISPDHSLCWSLSPVSRKKPLQEPLGSSTPSKTLLFPNT